MINEVLNVRPVDLSGSIPDGRYAATCTNRDVRFRVHDIEYQGHADTPIEGENVLCEVSVSGSRFVIVAKGLD